MSLLVLFEKAGTIAAAALLPARVASEDSARLFISITSAFISALILSAELFKLESLDAFFLLTAPYNSRLRACMPASTISFFG